MIWEATMSLTRSRAFAKWQHEATPDKVLDLLQARFGQPPEDLRKAVRATANEAHSREWWSAVAILAASLEVVCSRWQALSAQSR
jgi:hypothetical protein